MKILFITGHRRSGTTLIGTLLDDANELCVYPGDISIFMLTTLITIIKNIPFVLK